MNKIIFLCIFSCIFFSQCNNAKWSRITKYTIKNETNNTLFMCVYPLDVDAYTNDTLVSNINPKTTIERVFYQHNITRRNYGWIFSKSLFLYNLTDTTSISENEFGTYVDSSKFITPYVSFIRDHVGEYEVLESTTLRICNSLTQSMPKDYTMLEKFKDYYSTSH